MWYHQMAKQFIFKTKESYMMVVELGYTKYVMSNKDAVTIADILEKAELYEQKWRKEEDGGTTYHVYDNDKQFTLTSLTNSLYSMAKLAGKPVKE
jgi:predicted DNA-binding ArsR family transcriptional regulator